MSVVPGLSANLRQLSPEPDDEPSVAVEVVPNSDAPEVDEAGNLLKIDHGDGSVTVSIDGRPVERGPGDQPIGWFDNLADEIDQGELSRIADDLLRGINDDLTSRNEWIEDRAQGIKLLGLKVEIPGLQGASDGAPVEGMSKVRHPLLLEAVLRFQANARSELLPTDGPVKVKANGPNVTAQTDDLADDLEAAMNDYLTSKAKEYYPDTDKMLFKLGFGGTAFKKVYFCPLRGRPVSETVDADDLIVNNAAKTLEDAKRVTHRIMLRSSTVKRLQILGVYRDVDLAQAVQPNIDASKRAQADQQGIAQESLNPEDRDREIYECYCELDITGFEHKYKGKATGLEIPYRVTIDVSSREILSISRNYDQPTGEEGDELPEALQTFVKYTFVPGLGFYDIGLLHMLGNTTNAVTAAWREMLDAGMYANFPGFLLSDTGARQNTNIFRVPPGGGALVKTGGMPINQAVMPLPYKEPGMALMNLINNMVETGQRVGSTSETNVGEGRQDAPVGTTLALIEQATKVLSSVHKRLHAAQAEEFRLLRRCFQDHPESFLRSIKNSNRAWTEEILIEALNSYELTPMADPNTASHTQRIMKVMALKQLQAASPQMYNAQAIDIMALKTMGWSNPEQFLAPPDQAQQPPPEAQAKMAELQIKKQDADSKQLMAQAKAQEAAAKAQAFASGGMAGEGVDDKSAELQLKAGELEFKHRQLDYQQHRDGRDDVNRDQDREAELSIERARLIMEQMRHQDKQQQEMHRQGLGNANDFNQRAADVERALAQAAQTGEGNVQ